MRKFTIKATLCVMFGLLAVGQAFAAGEKCAAGTKWGGFTTVIPDTTSDGVYKISSPDELAWFACEVTKRNVASVALNAKLTQSIDLQGKLFIPIAAGKGTPSYGGTFDGQGYTIKNLFIDASEIVKSGNGGNKAFAQNVALFASIKGGTVQNLSLESVSIYAASSAGDEGTSGSENPISVGAIAGFVEAGTISGCAASGKIETSGATNRVGGIAGNVWAATISNCISEVNIYATGDNTHVGGIVGVVRDKNGSVTLESCVYAGETLFSNNGAAGAVAGQYEKKGNITTNDLYYTSDYPAVGTGLGDKPFDSKPVEDLNTEDVICELNGGTWNTDDQTCTGASADGIWSEGQNDLSMNGSDGLKVTFDANGGAFAEGTKVSKFFAKNAPITANEIENPTFANNKFVGWSLTQGGAVQDLGVADKAKTVYAVWKPIRTITFNAAPGAFDGGSSVASKLVAEGDVVTVEGLPALPVKFCSQETAGNCDKYAYFHGWSTVSHAPYGENENIPEENIVDLPTFVFNSDTTLFAVWVEFETYTVTFNANGHGQTKVAFVKVGKGETTVQPPDPNADDGYIFTGRWCKVAPCDEKTKFGFDTTEIDTSIILYADWEISEYDITYIIDGDTNTETGNQAKYSVESDPITLVKPDSAGYVFDGWYDEDGNEATTIRSGSTENKTFRGSWVPVTYTITYLADNTLSATTASEEKTHGVAKKLKEATFVHGGCTQDGWSKVSYGKDGYNLDYVVGGSYEEDKDVILFPHWNCGTYNIAYEMYGVEGVINHADNPDQYTGPAAVTLKYAYDPNDSKRMPMRWYFESTFKTVASKIQDINKDITLYAGWYNIITIQPGTKLKNFNKDAGKVEKEKKLNASYTLGIPNDKYKITNYTLDGWSTTDGGEKVYDVGFAYTDNVNITLYPHWVESRDSVQYGAVKIYTYASDGRKEAVINGNYTGTDVVEISSDIPVNSVTLDRTFKQNVLSSLFLPFSISASQISGATKIYKFNRVAQNDEGIWKVKVSAVTDLTANTPYMVLPSDDGKLTFNIDDPVAFNTTTGPETHSVINGTWEFKGVYAHVDFDENFPDVSRVYGFAAQAADGYKAGDFVKVGIGADIPAMRAYLVHHSAPLQKSSAGVLGQSVIPDVIEIEIENENGIVVQTGKLNTVTGEVRMDRWFDLKGRKLNSKPTVKGTYYKNGKRVIVK